MHVSIQHEFDRLAAALRTYARVTGRDAQEVLDRKGRDLGIQLFRAFRSRQWGGHPRATRGRTLARLEADARARRGRGTVLRPSLQREYERELRAASVKGATGRRRVRGRRLNLRQKYVGRELSLRGRGLGVLAASFLWFRRRASSARGVYYVRNRTGRPLGQVQRGRDFLRITATYRDARGRYPHALVSNRYGLVAGAVRAVRADTESYLRRKQQESVRRAFRAAGLRVT
ncbi:MAG: hypothetical protein D6781_13095 [Verrucomicrobia bacterium]|nr:MAG: hypothetical protein D6781_13095 [Verrucomicrobiota bacterium]